MAEDPKPATPGLAAEPRPNRIGVSSYSFWGFKRDDLRPIDVCLEHAVNSPWLKVTLDTGNFLVDPLTAIPRSLAMPRDAFKA